MDIYDLLIQNLGSVLALANQTMSFWIDLPANATGPLDPGITLTSAGSQFVGLIVDTAIGVSNIIAEATAILF